MTKVTALRGAVVQTNEPNEVLIEVLIEVAKKILADAESGRLQSLLAAGFLNDGLRMSCIVNTHPNVYEVIGSIEMLKMDCVKNYTEPL